MLFNLWRLTTLSHHLDFRFKRPRCRWGSLALPLLLTAIAFGQPGGGQGQKNTSVQFVNMFSSDADVKVTRTPCQHLRDTVRRSRADVAGERPATCDQILDIIAGKASPLPANIVAPIQAAKIAVDSRLRVLITEPTTRTVHILDFVRRRYLRIDGAQGDRIASPYGLAVDANNSIYVTDLVRGRIAVYNANGRFKKYLGEFKNEGAFEGAQSLAIDGQAGRIYVADTTRNFVVILDLNGKTLAQIGKRGGGSGPAEFKGPSEIAIYKNEVFVLDRRNDRIQVLDLAGHFQRQFRLGRGEASEANGMALDAQGRLFVPSPSGVEVFNREGKLLFRFGRIGDQQGEFQVPKGICTDSKDRVYVVDSGNRRIQVFQVTDQSRLKMSP